MSARPHTWHTRPTYEYVVRGTGNATTDTAALTAAAAAACDHGSGTIWIEGDLWINDLITFDAGVSLRGRHQSATITAVDNDGQLSWGNISYEPFSGASALTATGERQPYIVDPGLSLAVGDYFFAYSSDIITGVTHTSAAYTSCPGEVHCVSDVRTSNCYFDDVIIDALTTTPKIRKLSMIKNFAITDLTFAWTGSTPPSNNFLNMRQCANFRLENVHWESNGPNGAFMLYCYDVKCSGIMTDHQRSYNNGTGYVIIAGPVNKFLLCDSAMYGARHVFTTGMASNGGTPAKLTGTCRNTVIDNCIGGGNGNDADVGDGVSASSLVPFDTHSGGWGVTFQNCVANVPGETTNRGFQSRSRHSIFRNCTINGGMSGGSQLMPGMYLLSADNEVYGCTFNDCWRAIEIREDGSGGVSDSINNQRIYGNRIKNCYGPGITILNGDGHYIHNNIFENCGQAITAGAVTFSQSVIFLATTAGTGHRIMGNDIKKFSNTYSIDVGDLLTSEITITGNYMDGYGAGSMDIEGTDEVNIESAQAGNNYTD